MQLAAYSNNNFFLGHAAMLVNEGLPNFIVTKLKERYPLGEMTVGIAGMAFKADIDDGRDSLSYKLRKILRLEARQVLCSDPYIRDPDFVDLGTLLERSDILILGAPHRQYRDLNVDGRRVVDVWNLFGKGGLGAL
jgi:UDP-N-acetyl-D-mannosaminuronic acid dehydrogenase